jgi:hypothetical protein
MILLVVTAVASFLGAYLAEKGKNFATQEDIQRLTKAIEETKIQYARQLEDYKNQQKIIDQAARVAELLAMVYSPDSKDDTERFHRLAWELSLWLPAEMVRDITRCLCQDEAGKRPKEILIAARKILLSDPNDSLLAEQIVHHTARK